METDTLATLQSLDLAVITDIVRQDQANPAFDLLEWTVEPIAHEAIISTTGGIYRFSGYGTDGIQTKPWAIVLKIVKRPPGTRCQDPPEWCYWKREMLAFQSGMLATLPDGIHTPRCCGTTEHEDSVWIWMESIVESTGRRWSLDHYYYAARQLGRFGGAFLSGYPMPNYAWLSPFFRSVFGDGGLWAGFMNPQSSDNAWQNPLVQRTFTALLRSRVLQIWDEKMQFFAALDQLPQVLCHNDLHRRNLMIRTNADGPEDLVAVDWAFCGPGAVGADLTELVINSTYFFEIEPVRIGQFEEAAFEGYLHGLRDLDWKGDPRLVRLGYITTAALWMGATLPGWVAIMLTGERAHRATATYGRSVDEILEGWTILSRHALDLADESRQLMRTLF
jgi:hypothetical protein